jgi:hypothetical protein
MMPKYFISFQNNSALAQDDEGQDLPGLDEARTAAMVSAREILADNIKGNAKNPLLVVIITNETGKELMRIDAKDVLPAGICS